MRKRRGVPFAKGQKFCVFCGGPGLSKTHIWPKWLNELLAPGTGHNVELERPKHTGQMSESYPRQGSIFSQKPYLACEVCNGALGTLEDEMKAFAPPLFSTSSTEMRLTVNQQRTLAGWISLITVLAEHIDKSKSSVVITERDVRYLKEHRVPPSEWTICSASLDGAKWTARYRHHARHIGKYTSEAQFWTAVRAGTKSNTQISSFGIGRLFFQVFTCPDPRFVSDYRRCAEISELGQVWPIPSSIFTRRTLKLPTNLVLSDETADALADAYSERIKELTELSV
jgi:hypothetical protein